MRWQKYTSSSSTSDDNDDNDKEDECDKEDDDFDDANSNVNSANKQQRVATRSQKKKTNTIDYQWRLCRESSGTNWTARLEDKSKVTIAIFRY